MDATLGLPILVGLVAVALLFDFLNGLHDAANSIATIVSTRVLRPQYAVIWAAFFNFVAFAVFGLHVANTIGTGIIEPSIIDATVIFGAVYDDAMGDALRVTVVATGLGRAAKKAQAAPMTLLKTGTDNVPVMSSQLANPSTMTDYGALDTPAVWLGRRRMRPCARDWMARRR